jgi:hypothetical protein
MKYIEIVHSSTNTVVKRIDVTGSSERKIEQVERGVLINLNMNAYHTTETDSEVELELNPKVEIVSEK